jgi:LuxR family maltose regulon positive regulatory protein
VLKLRPVPNSFLNHTDREIGTVKKGKVEDIWLSEIDINLDDITYFKTKLTYTMYARAMVALGRDKTDSKYLKAALGLLEELLELAETNGWGSKVIEVLALQAIAFQENGNSELALTKLEQALILAEPEGFIRTFVDEGPPMASLLPAI